VTDGVALLTAEEMQRADRRTIEEIGVPGLALMESAAWACCLELMERWPAACQQGVVIACGPGNNGADGLAMARRLHGRGIPTQVVLHGEPASDDARAQLAMAQAAGVPTEPGPWPGGAPGVLVDALFGTGLTRPLRGAYAKTVAALTASDAPCLAVDIPSGVHGSTGDVLGGSGGSAVQADVTVTFAAPKRGHFLQPGRQRRGSLVVADIGIETPGRSRLRLVGPEALVAAAPPADPEAHKGTFGHVLVVAGSPGKTGAAALTAMAALRAGAGLVTLAVPTGGRDEAPAEVMTVEVPGQDGVFTEESLEAVRSLLATRDALALGPGIGTDPRTGAFVRALHQASIPAVVDADALNLLAGGGLHSAAPRVLTPHPGEMRRLLPPSTGRGPDADAEYAAALKAAGRAERPRLDQVHRLAKASGGVGLLKGASTLVRGEQSWLVPTGNPAMGTAGSGDVLTGVIAALLARGASPELAARAGAWWHGAAGDRAAATRGEPGVVASDIADELGPAWLDAQAGRSPAPFGSRP